MLQLVTAKATLDFVNKTIEFESDFNLSDLHLIQESIKDWKKWRIVKPVSFTVTPYIPPANPLPWYPYQPTWYISNQAVDSAAEISIY